MMKQIYLFVEGNTDKALIEALLQKCFNYREYNNKNDMPHNMARQIANYPSFDGDLHSKSRPSFVYKENVSFMIEVVGGKDLFSRKIAGRLKALTLDTITDEMVVALIQDRDLATEDEIDDEVRRCLNKQGIIWNGEKITYENENFMFYRYYIPMKTTGAVEKLILEMANLYHPELTLKAKEYKDAIVTADVFEKYRKEWARGELYQRLYADKVQVGAITAVLKPDSSPAMMVKDKLIHTSNTSEIKENEEMRCLINFLDSLQK